MFTECTHVVSYVRIAHVAGVFAAVFAFRRVGTIASDVEVGHADNVDHFDPIVDAIASECPAILAGISRL